MSCQCQSKLEELQEAVDKRDKRIASAADEGPYWVRKVASNLVMKMRDELEKVDCDCQAAQRINQSFTLVNDPSVHAIVSQGGGGGTRERVAQDAAYSNLKQIITSKSPEVMEFVAINNGPWLNQKGSTI